MQVCLLFFFIISTCQANCEFIYSGIIIQIHGSNASLMHHKFAIIDEDIMIYGSTNWTMQAFYGNYDSILITNDDIFVKAFINEFARIWKKQDCLHCLPKNK